MAGLVEKLVKLVGRCADFIALLATSWLSAANVYAHHIVPCSLYCPCSAFYSDEHIIVLSALIREKFMKVGETEDRQEYYFFWSFLSLSFVIKSSQWWLR